MRAHLAAVLASLNLIIQSTTALRLGSKQTWRSCANEGDPIPAASLVRFGFGMVWTQSTELEEGAPCSIASFGVDPVPNIMKMCECMGMDSDGEGGRQRRTELGLEWRRCADEGEDCVCDGGAAVRFGSGSRWVVSEPGRKLGVLRCAAESFQGMDPDAGQGKECWCEGRPKKARRTARVAVVLVSRRPPDLRNWLRYHFDFAGVEHVFMQIEDTPHFQDAWGNLAPEEQRRVTRWDGNTRADGGSRPFDDYATLQARQIAVMKHARKTAYDMGIDWLVHIDDDELLYVPAHLKVGEVLANLPHMYDQAFVPNVEAVYPSADVASCFQEAKEVNVNPFTFVSYANGKSAVRVRDGDDVVPAGPHFWHHATGQDVSSVHLDKEPFGSPLLVLHYESCPFQRWKDKFWELSNTSEERIGAIPFGFYRESIRASRTCASDSPSLRPECSEASLKRMWSKYKTEQNPAYRRQDLMPIDIPWTQIRGATAHA